MRRRRLAARLWCFLLAAAGIAAIVGAMVIPNPHLRAVQVNATVVESRAGTTTCDAHGGVRLSFQWEGRTITADQILSQLCDRYRPGDRVIVYVPSNDPTDVQATQSAVLDPSTVDPFEVIGPNDLNGFLGFLGAGSVVGCAILYFLEIRRRTPSPSVS